MRQLAPQGSTEPVVRRSKERGSDGRALAGGRALAARLGGLSAALLGVAHAHVALRVDAAIRVMMPGLYTSEQYRLLAAQGSRLSLRSDASFLSPSQACSRSARQSSTTT